MNEKYPRKCIIDTNVPKTANLARRPEEVPAELIKCVFTCIDAIEYVTKQGHLVLDAGDEIFTEYRQQLSMSGQPGVGDHFMKWVHDHRWKFPSEDRVSIIRTGDSYREFPEHEALSNFDKSDRKFVAVANAHPEKPPILQATDSKWWGWKDVLAVMGITIQFLCPDYAKLKYEQKTR